MRKRRYYLPSWFPAIRWCWRREITSRPMLVWWRPTR